ncbi:MAG: hypothetical protein ABIZ07_12725, partial [Dermatophilaceae bacterium]
MADKLLIEDVSDRDLEVGEPKDWAAGVPGVTHAMLPAMRRMGVTRSAKTLLAMNQRDGFDCM